MLLEQQLYSLSVELGEKLKQQNYTITCAESCTGGLLAKSITDIAGSSAYFECGVITYSNQAKQVLLGVSAETLAQFGAVSQQTAYQMAAGALQIAKADIAIAITGIAGPAGGSKDKPVGTVCFGWAYRHGHIQTAMQCFTGDRQSVRLQATIYALKYLSEKLS